jgi:uncharacterized protein involved in cysteine biosynthesis
MQEDITPSQLRSFSFLVGTVFAAIGLWPLIVRGQHPRLWALILAAFLIIPGIVWPTALKPVYRVWMTIGQVLGWVNTRIILAVMFYFVFAPVAILMRMFRKDLMRRKLEPSAETYRIRRLPRAVSHMNRQF